MCPALSLQEAELAKARRDTGALEEKLQKAQAAAAAGGGGGGGVSDEKIKEKVTLCTKPVSFEEMRGCGCIVCVWQLEHCACGS